MKILATSDIHQMSSKWKELVKICNEQKPDICLIAGDLLPKDNGILYHLNWFKHMEKYAKQINDNGTKLALMLGNDDNQLLIPKMEEGEKEGLWYHLHEKIVEIDGYEFVGMPYVPDYPFGYKFWCHSEFKDNLRINETQFMKPCLVADNNKFKNIKDYPEYLKSKKSIWESLTTLADKVKDIKKSIWMIHAPPSDMGLDVCAHGEKVGSVAVLRFIEEYHPLLTIHGHIHESPEYNGKKWKQWSGGTLCIQGGQMDFDVHYSMIELENGEIKSAKHSIYG